MDPLWRIYLLGGVACEHGATVLRQFGTRKNAALLAYLAYFRDRQHPREVLIDLLWPDSDLDAGRKSLSVALSALRHLLEPERVAPGSVLQSDRFMLQLNPAAIETDVSLLDAALTRADRAESSTKRLELLEQAIGYWKGPLLPGFYEAWIPPEHERLSERVYRAMTEAAGLLERAGDAEAALQYARRAVAFDPLREEAHRDLMRLYATVGRLDAALRQYGELSQALQKELGVGPSPATRALHEELRSGAFPAMAVMRDVSARGAAERAGEARGQLPRPLTRFFGRKDELARLEEMLRCGSARLVTLTGVGGSGKTRLAVEVAERLHGAFEGGVRFVPLAETSEPGQALDAIRAAVPAYSASSSDTAAQIALAIGDRRTLLVIDNFEQLVEVGAPTLRNLLERAPSLVILVTSRQRLNLQGEREMFVEPLPVPAIEPADAEPDPDSLLTCDSVALFADRVQAMQASQEGWRITPAAAPTVARICARLDGLPLAIELAAARSPLFSPQEMLSQLENRLDFLTSRWRDVDPRHRSLRTTLDWSFRLLAPELQRLFAQLSVFRGGWTMDAAEEICGEPRALEYIEQLREWSLVQVTHDSLGARFRMLDTLRDYAGELLDDQERTALEDRHASWYCAMAVEAEPHLHGTGQMEWLERLDADFENLRAAFDRLERSGAGTQSLELAGAMSSFWCIRGRFREGQAWLLRALAMDGGPAERARALRGYGQIAWFEHDFAGARDRFAEAQAIFHEIADALGEATCRHGHAMALFGLGDFATARTELTESVDRLRALGAEWQLAYALDDLAHLVDDPAAALALDDESMSIFRSLGDRLGVAFALEGMTHTLVSTGDLVGARARVDEAIELFRELGNAWGMAVMAQRLGDIALMQGDVAEAVTRFRQAQSTFSSMANPFGLAVTQHSLGIAALEQGDADAARHYLEDAASRWRAMGYRLATASSATSLAVLARRAGRFDEAERLLAEALEVRKEYGDRVHIARTLHQVGRLARARGDIDRALETERESIRLLGPEARRGILFSALEGIAGCFGARGDFAASAQLIGAADAGRRESRSLNRHFDQDEFERDLADAREALGEAAFQREHAAGAAMPLAAAVQLALGQPEDCSARIGA